MATQSNATKNSPKPVVQEFTTELIGAIKVAYAAGDKAAIVKNQAKVRRMLKLAQMARKEEIACFDSMTKVSTPDYLKGVTRMVKYSANKGRPKNPNKPEEEII